METRLKKLCALLSTPTAVVDFNEYRKARLIFSLLTKSGYAVDCNNFEIFMEKADMLEVSIVERLKTEAARDGWRRSEAWFRAEAFQQSVKYLRELPAFTDS